MAAPIPPSLAPGGCHCPLQPPSSPCSLADNHFQTSDFFTRELQHHLGTWRKAGFRSHPDPLSQKFWEWASNLCFRKVPGEQQATPGQQLNPPGLAPPQAE